MLAPSTCFPHAPSQTTLVEIITWVCEPDSGWPPSLTSQLLFSAQFHPAPPPTPLSCMLLCKGLGISEFFQCSDVTEKIFPLDSECPAKSKGREIFAPLHYTLFCFGMRHTIACSILTALSHCFGKAVHSGWKNTMPLP